MASAAVSAAGLAGLGAAAPIAPPLPPGLSEQMKAVLLGAAPNGEMLSAAHCYEDAGVCESVHLLTKLGSFLSGDIVDGDTLMASR